jgi:nucleoside-diphosphate-sugar epimerase
MTELSRRRVLITGATGFVGTRLCRELVDRNNEVHAVCRSGSGAALASVRSWECALHDHAKLKDLLLAVKPDFVFHLAGFTSASREMGAVLPAFQANLVATVNLLTAFAETGGERMVLAGSFEEPTSGDDPPSSPYATSKWAGTGYARMFEHLYQTPVTVARIFMVYGPGQRDTKKLIPSTILSALRGVNPQISSGTRQLDWIYIDDVISGLIALGEAEGVDSKGVDIGTGILTTVREVVEKISNQIDPALRPVIGAIPDRPDEQVRAAGLERTKSVLEWKPKVGLEEGLQRTIEHYRKHLELYPP